MDKLLPCPFCRGEVTLMGIAGAPFPPTYEVDVANINEQSDDVCYIHCPGCKANWHIERRIDSFPRDTIAAWNRRAQSENKPLTLDELREMDGEPIYIVEIHGREGWNFRRNGGIDDCYGEWTADEDMNFDGYGSLWVAYRTKPERSATP